LIQSYNFKLQTSWRLIELTKVFKSYTPITYTNNKSWIHVFRGHESTPYHPDWPSFDKVGLNFEFILISGTGTSTSTSTDTRENFRTTEFLKKIKNLVNISMYVWHRSNLPLSPIKISFMRWSWSSLTNFRGAMKF